MIKGDTGFHVVTFASVSYAITAEKMMENSADIKMIPTPREITASCGMALRIDGCSGEEALMLFHRMEDAHGLYLLGPKIEGKRNASLICVKNT